MFSNVTTVTLFLTRFIYLRKHKKNPKTKKMAEITLIPKISESAKNHKKTPKITENAKNHQKYQKSPKRKKCQKLTRLP